eukprot:3962581-Amphidinium_carterae.1
MKTELTPPATTKLELRCEATITGCVQLDKLSYLSKKQECPLWQSLSLRFGMALKFVDHLLSMASTLFVQWGCNFALFSGNA